MCISEALLDCTEIKVQRPADEKEQEDTYNGKKKHNTVKKLIIGLLCGYIAFTSHHFVGRVADKKIADLETIKFLKGSFLWTDLGFIGFNNADVDLVIP